jgi:hypothetical protein
MVAFLGGDLVPLACSATPDPPSLIVRIGTRVILANFTGADATVDIGAELPVEVAAGTAISVRFGLGEHTVTMAPKCIRTFGLVPVEISVRRAADLPPTPAPGTSASADPSPDASPTATGHPIAPPDSSDSVSADSAPGRSAAVGPRAGHGGRDGSALAGGDTGSEPVPAVGAPGDVDLGLDVEVAASVGPVDRGPDARGRRLLALVATICVFGVTSAIIRAIVAQRTTRGLGPR